jgi:hypothetical protein
MIDNFRIKRVNSPNLPYSFLILIIFFNFFLQDRDKRMKRTVHKPMSYPQQNVYKMDSTNNEIVNDLDLGAKTEKRIPAKTEIKNDIPIKHLERPAKEPIVDVLATDHPPRSYGPIRSRRVEKPVVHEPEREEESILSVRGERLRYGRRSSIEGEKLVEKYDVHTSSICERPPTRGEKRVQDLDRLVQEQGGRCCYRASALVYIYCPSITFYIYCPSITFVSNVVAQVHRHFCMRMAADSSKPV